MNLIEIGKLYSRGGTGPQNVPHVDSLFQASGFIFFSTDTSFLATAGVFNIGCDDGVNHFGTSCANSTFGTEHGWGDTQSIIAVQGPAFFELKVQAHVTAMNVGSFDLQWDQNDIASGREWCYIAFSARMKCKAGKINSSTTFPYDINLTSNPIALFGNWHKGIEGGTFAATGTAAPTIGFAVSCTADSQVSLANEFYKTYQHKGKWLTSINTAGTILGEYEVIDWNFTSNKITVDGPAFVGEYVSYLAVSQGTGDNFSANLDVFDQGTNPVPIISNSPTASIFGSFCNTASLVTKNGTRIAFGATDGIRQLSTFFNSDSANLGDSVNSVLIDKIITLAHPTGSNSSAIDAQASFVSYASQAINTLWNIDDGIKRECFQVTFAEDVSIPPFCGGSGSSCCVDGKRRIEVNLNDKRQFSASIPQNSYAFEGLIDALKNDIVDVTVYQETGIPLNVIASVEVHRVSYVQHLKESGRNLEEPD